ncbi:neutral protease [Bacillus amyloliquefaciens]|nr:neutral protease [Bacillus amyloliquefaciens]
MLIKRSANHLKPFLTEPLQTKTKPSSKRQPKRSLAYDVTIRYIEPEPANWEVTVDAETGKILKKQNKVEHAATTGTGTTLKGKTVSLRKRQICAAQNYYVRSAKPRV